MLIIAIKKNANNLVLKTEYKCNQDSRMDTTCWDSVLISFNNLLCAVTQQSELEIWMLFGGQWLVSVLFCGTPNYPISIQTFSVRTCTTSSDLIMILWLLILRMAKTTQWLQAILDYMKVILSASTVTQQLIWSSITKFMMFVPPIRPLAMCLYTALAMPFPLAFN